MNDAEDSATAFSSTTGNVVTRSQDARRRAATCFVALADEHQIAGFYALASACVP